MREETVKLEDGGREDLPVVENDALVERAVYDPQRGAVTVPEKHPHAVYGRAFALQDGTVILPCGWCGTPEWPGAEHHCPGVDAETVRRLEQE